MRCLYLRSEVANLTSLVVKGRLEVGPDEIQSLNRSKATLLLFPGLIWRHVRPACEKYLNMYILSCPGGNYSVHGTFEASQSSFETSQMRSKNVTSMI